MGLLRLAALLIAMSPASAAGDELTLTFGHGRVTLTATRATLRQVLTEWARRGQTRIVGLEKVTTGAPLTLTLMDVPEKTALEVLLRSLAGYIAAPRRHDAPALSQFDRILLMPTSVASRAPVGPRPNAFAPPPPPPDPIQNANEEPAPADPAAPGGVPVFNPNGQAPVIVPNGQAPVIVPPGPPPPGTPTPLTPYPGPNDANAAPQETPPAPVLTGRPGIIPAPQRPPQPRP